MGEKDEHIHFDKQTAKIKAIKIAYQPINYILALIIWRIIKSGMSKIIEDARRRQMSD